MLRKLTLVLTILAALPSAACGFFAKFQTYSIPQIFYNIVTDGGATCNGDSVIVTRNVTSVLGSKNITVDANQFTGGDVGKLLRVPGVGFVNGNQYSIITSVGAFSAGSQTVVVTDNATASNSISSEISYGLDDAIKFKAFNIWALANQGSAAQVVLTIPNGSVCWFGSTQTFAPAVPGNISNAWAGGIRNLLVQGAGATLTAIGGSPIWLGGIGMCEKGLAEATGCSARIQTASAGASQITLTAASLSAGYISRFSVNSWIMLGGLNVQATTSPGSGQPPNLHYFEYRQITAIDVGTGVITLDRPLTNSYLSTWPGYNDGNSGHADPGGPATIWLLGDSWQYTAEYRGFQLLQVDQTYSPLRHVTFRDMTFSGVGGQVGAIPSQNETWSAYNVDYTGRTLEVDKGVGTMTVDGMVISQLKFQSSSVDLFIGRNLTITNNLTGGAKRTEITDATIPTWAPGAYAYGASAVTICTRCAVTNFTSAGGVIQGGISSGLYSMSGGVVSFLNADNTDANGGPFRTFVPPKGNIFYYVASGGSGDTIGLVNIPAVTQDATNTFIQTNEAGGFPTWTFSSLLGYRAHPSPQFTCDACTGTISLTSMNVQNGATPLAPMGSYVSANFAPTSAQGDLGFLPTFGRLTSATINVTQAYSGAGSATLNVTREFNNLPTVKQSDWTDFTWGPQINLKQTGSRVITPSGVTCNGVAAPTGCSGDSLGTALPEAVWIKGGIQPFMGSTLGVGTQPLVTITIQTDQGVVP